MNRAQQLLSLIEAEDFDWGSKGRYKSFEYLVGQGKDEGKFAIYVGDDCVTFTSREDMESYIDKKGAE